MTVRAASAVLLLALTAGCTADQPKPATLSVDAPEAPADQAVHISVGGLTSGKNVEIVLTTGDINGKQWRGHAVFKAAPDGTVDLIRDAPVSGTYTGADGMGLFWSMDPPTGDLDHASYSPPVPRTQAATAMQLSVLDGKHVLARRQLIRQWAAAGVTYRLLTVGNGKLSFCPDPCRAAPVAQLFRPAPGGPSKPGVLYFTGSDGAVDPWTAALLASHGFPAMVLAYFKQPGLPQSLTNVPIEYFGAAAKLLSEQPGVADRQVVIAAYARGTEAALMTAQHYPALIRGLLLYAPSNAAGRGYPVGANAWTLGGRPVPIAPIPVNRIAGPVLAVAGGADNASVSQSTTLMGQLDAAGVRPPHRVLVYPQAGRDVGTFPFTPRGTRAQLTVDGSGGGGTPAVNAAARADGWPKALQFLDSVTAQG